MARRGCGTNGLDRLPDRQHGQQLLRVAMDQLGTHGSPNSHRKRRFEDRGPSQRRRYARCNLPAAPGLRFANPLLIPEQAADY